MSDLPRSVKDNGVVETVLAIVVGLGIVGLGLYVRGDPRTGGDPQGPLLIIGFGGIWTLSSAVVFVQRLRKIPTRDPVAILRGDLNDRDRILWDLGKLALFWVGAALFWEFIMHARSPNYPSLAELATQPVAVVGLLALTVLVALNIVFGSTLGGKTRRDRI